MRAVSWSIALCVLLAIAGVFMPALEARVGGLSFGKHASLSLYKASAHRALARSLFASYAGSKTRRYGEALATALLPRAKSRAHEVLDDATSAMSTLDDVSDSDVKTGGITLTAAVWAFLALQLVLGALVLVESQREGHRRGRLVVALGIALVVTAIAIALHLVCREAAWQANDEVGTEVLALGMGAYVMPVASIGGAVGMIALLVVELRRRRSQASRA